MFPGSGGGQELGSRLATGAFMRVIVAAITACIALPAFALQPTQLSDEQVRSAIVQESVRAYLATGHPCACPFNSARAGHACGGRSAYSRPGGAAPLCYPSDVSAGKVADWRRAHP